MSSGISEANREADYSIDPMYGTCNACHAVGCSVECMRAQRDAAAASERAACAAIAHRASAGAQSTDAAWTALRIVRAIQSRSA